MKIAFTTFAALFLVLGTYEGVSANEKARCERGDCRGGGRVDRGDRGGRIDRGDRGDRGGRIDRGDRGGRIDRGNRGGDVRPSPRWPDVRPVPRRPDVRPAPRHNPRIVIRNHTPRYTTSRDYVRVVPRNHVYRNRWVRWNDSRFSGLFWEDDYPYYGHGGYRYRYSPVEYCNYDLVDDYSDQVFERFYGMTCQNAYDYCSDLRDDLNYSEPYGQRYFCAEAYSY